METRVLVAGIGNIFFRDDGFGPAVAAAMLPSSSSSSTTAGGPLPDGVRVVDYGIRGLHLAYDLLGGVDALLIVDALPGANEAGALTVLEVGPDDLGTGAFDAHGMDPVSVLASLGAMGGELPRTLVVGCQPGDVGEGIGLTPEVSRAVDRAVPLVNRLAGDLLTQQVAGVSMRQEA